MTDDIKTIKDKVDSQVKTEKEQYGEKPEDQKKEISEEKVTACLRANERGDGILFAEIHGGQYLYDKSIKKEDSWLKWGGHSWAEDVLDTSHDAVEAVALEYLKVADKFNDKLTACDKIKDEDSRSAARKAIKKEQELFTGRAYRVRGSRGVSNCLKFAHTVKDGLAVTGEEFDKNPYLLGCSNGVIELDTGEFRDGRQDDYVLMNSPHEFKGMDEPCEQWEKFLLDIFDDDQEMVDYIQRLFGYATSGLVQEHVVPILYGEGRNGKGTFIEMISYVLGPQAEPINSEMLLEQKYNASSKGPSPDVMKLKGLRMAIASETDEDRRFAPSKVKLYSGADRLSARPPHGTREINFDPTHTLILLTNHKPHAPSDDFGFWDRIHLIKFPIAFVEHPDPETNQKPKDKGLMDKLKKEAPGILAWLARGFIAWKNEESFNTPLKVIKATNEYRLDEDVVVKFIKDRCVDLKSTNKENRVTYSDLCSDFEAWYERTIHEKCPKRDKIANMIVKKGITKKRKGGNMIFFGIELRFDSPEQTKQVGIIDDIDDSDDTFNENE